MIHLKGKTALVSGGNGGIGLAIALAFARAGADVAIIGRNAAKNTAAADEIAAAGSPPHPAITADMTDEAEVSRAIGEAEQMLGRIDVLVSNVGTNDRKRPEEYSFAEWRNLLSINLDSAFLAANAVYPGMKRSGGGKIITIGSMLSLFGSSMGAPYSAAKGGVVMLTKSLANAWAEDNIQVNAILPGWIDTDLTAAGKLQLPGLNERVIARTPAGHWGKPEHIGGAAVFFASSAADFVTGTALPVDGGYSSNG